ncbi:hypothetical protein LZ198_18195 [Myxococcus sp. K15C18031901]|uniref:hypothetical protein n=1 Tax=Myxococcus dinghuensis TaxID=2906761 RepID=UPI0020A7D644|nr:hypothetical protein [Myxococcus dinghuensis]MCP3100805.1 hypothetical protein [Myxococcus dinghuensis]
MSTVFDALELTDWSRLLHAYGRATETPAHLRALLELEPRGRHAAMNHLWSAILHQGTPWPATEVVARVAVGLLDDPRLDQGAAPVRAALLGFLAGVLQVCDRAHDTEATLEHQARFDLTPFIEAGDDDALYDDEEASDALHAQSMLGCLRVRPIILAAVRDGLDSPDAARRVRAAMAFAAFAQSVPEPPRKDLTTRVWTLARTTRDVDERASLVLALGDLGELPVEFSEDPSPGVRLCAALALVPAQTPDDPSTRWLIELLERQSRDVDGWFGHKPPQLAGPVRFVVLERLSKHLREFEPLAGAAEALARASRREDADEEWGPLLAFALRGAEGRALTVAQQRLLAALVENERVWVPGDAKPHPWFNQVGLPFNREACAQALAQGRIPRRPTRDG